MKKLIVLAIVVCLFLTGCSAKGLMDEIPDHEFKKFEYHRGGNATSAHIIATGAKRVNGKLNIESVNITADYGPFVNFNIKLEGYMTDNGEE